MELEQLRENIHRAAELMEAQVRSTGPMRAAIERMRDSIVASASKRAAIVGFTGSLDELDAAFEEWVGLHRFDAARRALIDALSDPMDGIPRPAG